MRFVLLMLSFFALTACVTRSHPAAKKPEALSESAAGRLAQTSMSSSNDQYEIVFVAWEPDGLHQIYAIKESEEEPVKLTQGDLNHSFPLWSPDGQKILFSLYHRDSPVLEDIGVMNADGSAQTKLTNDAAFNGPPAWSPDGRSIVFSSERDGNSEIYMMAIDEPDDVIRLTTSEVSKGHLDWSPDGRTIVFVAYENNRSDIYTMKIDGSEVTRLTEFAGEVRNPSWSPDGEKIAFIADDVVYVMNVNGKIQQKVSAKFDVSYGTPCWSPDGQYLMFAGKEAADMNSNVYVVSLADGLRDRLTDDERDYYVGAWSPDSTRLAVVGELPIGAYDLQIMSLDGTVITHLTDRLGLACCIDWRPAGP